MSKKGNFLKQNVKTMSTAILWSCMLITGIIFFISYYQYNKYEYTNPGIILTWSYIIFTAISFVTLAFGIYNMIEKWRTSKLTTLSTLISSLILIVLIVITFLFVSDDGTGKDIPEYYFLKIADICIYTLYILLGIMILAIVWSIIWSYIKRTR